MKFLFPAAWGALGLAVPIIVFYLIKTRLQRRLVSTTLFWQQLAPQIYNTSLWRKLRRWLSLLLQLLFLAALVFALAQPLASWQSLQPASLVIVLDPSASMEATDVAPSRWQRAVQFAEGLRWSGHRWWTGVVAGTSTKRLHRLRDVVDAVDEQADGLATGPDDDDACGASQVVLAPARAAGGRRRR